MIVLHTLAHKYATGENGGAGKESSGEKLGKQTWLDHPSENTRKARLILMYILIREQVGEGGQRNDDRRRDGRECWKKS